jgi:hypothetical protein
MPRSRKSGVRGSLSTSATYSAVSLMEDSSVPTPEPNNEALFENGMSFAQLYVRTQVQSLIEAEERRLRSLRR